MINLCPRCFAPLPAHSVTQVCIGCPARAAPAQAFPVFARPEGGTVAPSLMDATALPTHTLDALD